MLGKGGAFELDRQRAPETGSAARLVGGRSSGHLGWKYLGLVFGVTVTNFQIDDVSISGSLVCSASMMLMTRLHEIVMSCINNYLSAVTESSNRIARLRQIIVHAAHCVMS